MTLAHMAWRYLWTRPLVSVLTLTGIALGVALICGVLTMRRETEETFEREAKLFDLVVGAKGSPLQLVLNAVYDLDTPTGNVPYALYEQFKANPEIQIAIPIGLGDNYHNFRIVGTEPVLFELKERAATQPFFRIKEGRQFQQDFEVVLGSQVAQATGLKVGDSFVGTHGLVTVPGSSEHREFPYHVVGILEDTSTAQDRSIFGTLGSVWRIHDREAQVHEEMRGSAPKPPPPRETTAILLRLKAPGTRWWMSSEISKNTVGMPASPVSEIQRLYQHVLQPMQVTLLSVAAAVVVVACLTVLATLYQSAERRRRDVAIIRCLGGQRLEVGSLMLLEAVFLTLSGVVVGWLLGHGLLLAGVQVIREKAGFFINPWTRTFWFDTLESQGLALVLICGICAGLVPAISCYRRTPVHDLGVTE